MEGRDDYYLLWQRSKEKKKKSEFTDFRQKPKLDTDRLLLLNNLVDNGRFWPIEGRGARTLVPLQGKVVKGQWTDSSKFVCGFFVIKGKLATVVKKATEIDRSFADPFIDGLTGPGLDDFAAHATTTFTPVAGMEATAMLFWANNYKGQPRFPTDLQIGAIAAYNQWGRKVRNEGKLYDSGRMNVRNDAFHMLGQSVRKGPFSGERLLGIGSYARDGRPFTDAVKASGLLRDPTLAISAQKCNGWCTAHRNEPPAYDNPYNEIFV